MLRIYNTLTRTKEEFRPIEPGHVRMYVCGMTVYDYCHLGHARVLVAFDVVSRYLRSLGNRVTYVRNITDIDDKIIARASENGEDFNLLTQRFTEHMHEDCRALGVLAPDMEPRATHYIEPIVSMVERLIESGAAYPGGNGDVYYDVSTFPAYGALSDRRIEDLRSGARVEIDEAKDDPLDFVLWKSSKPGEPSWNRRGDRVGPAGISNARRWRRRALGITSTFTAEAWTCSFRTTRTRSPRARPPPAASS